MAGIGSTGGWATAHRLSIDDPGRFWGDAAAAIDWTKPWDRVLDDS
ncbi:MAG: acetyl-coenzyme A synthetase N-terminal domain-containing protein, partial [Dongiaceae bacterium]